MPTSYQTESYFIKKKRTVCQFQIWPFLYPQPPAHLDSAKLALDMMQQNIIVEASLNNVHKLKMIEFELK